MDLKQVKELMEFLQASKIKKLVYKKGDVEIQLEKEDSPAKSHPETHVGERHLPYAEHHHMKGGKREEGIGTFVTSPMVGTYYASPAPDQPAFVKVGDKVKEDTVVCIIEAMKVMNEVKAGMSGTVTEIVAENAQPVEFGTRLFRIT